MRELLSFALVILWFLTIRAAQAALGLYLSMNRIGII